MNYHNFSFSLECTWFNCTTIPHILCKITHCVCKTRHQRYMINDANLVLAFAIICSLSVTRIYLVVKVPKVHNLFITLKLSSYVLPKYIYNIHKVHIHSTSAVPIVTFLWFEEWFFVPLFNKEKISTTKNYNPSFGLVSVCSKLHVVLFSLKIFNKTCWVDMQKIKRNF